MVFPGVLFGPCHWHKFMYSKLVLFKDVCWRDIMVHINEMMASLASSRWLGGENEAVHPNSQRRRDQRNGRGGKNYVHQKLYNLQHLSENVEATFTWNRVKERWKPRIPTDRVPRNSLTTVESCEPAEHFQCNVPNFLWATETRIWWKRIPRKCSPHRAFGG